MPTTTHHRQATTGPAARMDHIYRTHSRYVANRIRQLLRPADVQEVEDLTQVVMLRAWRWLDTQTDPDRLTAWLRTIAVRVVADYYRRDRRPEAITPPGSRLWDALLPAQNNEPGEQWQCEALTAVLAALPARTAAAVQLREGHGLYGRQVAAILGCSKPTADRLVRDGLAALRSELATMTG